MRALFYTFLGDDVMEGTQSGLTQERGQQSPAGADSRQLQYKAEKRVTHRVMEVSTRVNESDRHFKAATRVMPELIIKRAPPPFRSYHTLPRQSLACPHDTIDDDNTIKIRIISKNIRSLKFIFSRLVRNKRTVTTRS